MTGEYHHFVPFEKPLTQQQKHTCIIFDMRGFHGWDFAALWEEIKFDFKQFGAILRLATIGDRTLELWMASFCEQFGSSEIRFFDQNEVDQAFKWIDV